MDGSQRRQLYPYHTNSPEVNPFPHTIRLSVAKPLSVIPTIQESLTFSHSTNSLYSQATSLSPSPATGRNIPTVGLRPVLLLESFQDDIVGSSPDPSPPQTVVSTLSLPRMYSHLSSTKGHSALLTLVGVFGWLTLNNSLGCFACVRIAFTTWLGLFIDFLLIFYSRAFSF